LKKIRIVVADDHAIVRDGICALLSRAGDMEVVGEAGNGIEATELVKQLNPDVILMDIAMPVLSGLEATRRICKEMPETRVLALTQYDDKEYVFPLIQAGALGFVSKTSASSELTSAIRYVHRGESYLSPSVAKLMVEDYQHGAAMQAESDPYEQLTDRERDVLKLVAEGYTTREIANILVISPKTVEGHKSSLMAKLNVHNRIELVKYALRRGLIDF
jgi:two-component system response regulator NreC